MSAETPAAAPAQEPNQFDLLRQRRFAPFFWTQFAGAANDNVYKNALVIFVAFQAASMTALDPNTLVNLAGAVFIAIMSFTGAALTFEKEILAWAERDARRIDVPAGQPVRLSNFVVESNSGVSQQTQ